MGHGPTVFAWCRLLTVGGVRGVQDKRHTHRETERDTEGRKKVPGCAAGVGSNRPMPKGRDNPTARGDLFNHLSYAPGGRETDSWVGNHLIGTTAVRSRKRAGFRSRYMQGSARYMQGSQRRTGVPMHSRIAP